MRRVLVVEDHDDAREMLVELLSIQGHGTREAADGGEALTVLSTSELDLAFVDLDLPDMDGFEVARRARQSGYTGRLVALTGYGQRADRERAARVGFDAHITKPISPEQLEQQLAASGPGV